MQGVLPIYTSLSSWFRSPMHETISVTITAQTGAPRRESMSANCRLTFDEDSATLQESDAYRRAVDSAVAACERALHEDTARRP